MPFSGQERRVGSFGFSIDGPFDKTRPAASMRKLLGSGYLQPTSYGALESPVTFTKHQLAMQVQKWRHKAGSIAS
jgi:hypothetical protein